MARRSATRSRRCRCRAGRTARAGPISATNPTRSFRASKIKDAAFKWIAFLSTGENNVELNKLTGQLPITTSGGASWTGHPRRFVEASAASLPIAGSLPDHPKTPDFIARIWPTNMQRALTGEIPPDDMMKAIEQHFNG